MAKTDRKEKLFQDFFHAAFNSFEALELQFGIRGIKDQVFGKDVDDEQAQSNLRASCAWSTLSALYDYAVNGLDGGEHPQDIVIAGSDVIELASSENHRPSAEWDQIIAMGDGRYALDEGHFIPLYKVALLANVDIRTVRNAVSAGDLMSLKRDNEIYIENASARRWLHGRRGFKPTVMNDGAGHLSLEKVRSPAEFGAFLVGQRARIGLDSTDNKLVVFHPSVNPQAIAQLEAGVFAMPLDAAFPLADFYQVGRKEFLECVMRVFFSEELDMLSHEYAKEEGQK